MIKYKKSNICPGLSCIQDYYSKPQAQCTLNVHVHCTTLCILCQSLCGHIQFTSECLFFNKSPISVKIFTVYLCIWGKTKWKESLSNREYTHSLILHLRSYLFWLPSFHLRLTIFWVQSSYGLIHVDVVLEKNIEKKLKKSSRPVIHSTLLGCNVNFQ